ncbi:MAG: hypothetical protein U1D69_10525 [Polynucleobacter sp.]|nr:hypothetical protein [Polynucleobacter sp.]
MSRPEALSRQQEETAQKNDERIIEALKRFELGVSADKPLPTVEDICVLAGVSRNTVRNRAWARDRLKTVKDAYKAARVAKGVPEEAVCQAAEANPAQAEEALRSQVEALLKQNVLLYEEVLYLGKLVAVKDVELDELRNSRTPSGKIRYMR